MLHDGKYENVIREFSIRGWEVNYQGDNLRGTCPHCNMTKKIDEGCTLRINLYSSLLPDLVFCNAENVWEFTDIDIDDFLKRSPLTTTLKYVKYKDEIDFTISQFHKFNEKVYQ